MRSFWKDAVWTRLELATPCVTGRYSNQLNYQTNFLTKLFKNVLICDRQSRVLGITNWTTSQKNFQSSFYKKFCFSVFLKISPFQWPPYDFEIAQNKQSSRALFYLCTLTLRHCAKIIFFQDYWSVQYKTRDLSDSEEYKQKTSRTSWICDRQSRVLGITNWTTRPLLNCEGKYTSHFHSRKPFL